VSDSFFLSFISVYRVFQGDGCGGKDYLYNIDSAGSGFYCEMNSIYLRGPGEAELLAEDLVQGHGEVGHTHHPDAERNLRQRWSISKS
jgi:hypothetical protein